MTEVYYARLGCEDLDSARQSQIEASTARSLQEEHHSQIGKGDDKDRFGKVEASPNLQSLIARSIFLNFRYIVLLLFFFSSAHAAEATLEEKPFVIIIPSYNNRDWYEQNLDSVFNQNYSNYRVIYIADAPTDGTHERVQDYIAQSPQRKRVTLLRNRERKGNLACLCQAAFTCSKEEIIVDLEGCDWLAHDDVLSHLNSVYADSDVWMTYGQFLYYPFYSKGFAAAIPEDVIKTNGFRNLRGCVSHLRTFYAALFQEIDKQDFLHEGKFFQEASDLAYLLPLLEMSGQHACFIPETLYMFNYSFPPIGQRGGSPGEEEMDRIIRSKRNYSPLFELPLQPTAPPGAIYQRINDISHPTHKDYKFIQSYLSLGKRDNLDRLGDMESRIRAMKIIGKASEENPSSGCVSIHCSLEDRENCIILYSSLNRNYPAGLERLLKHIEQSDFKGHVLYRIGGWPNEEGGSLVLSHVPYAFKPCFFKEAQALGYKRVLWLDVSVIPVASLNQIFAMIEENGYFIMGNSHSVGPFVTPQAAAYFGLTEAETFHIPSCSSGLFGLDLTQEEPRLLLDLWYRAAFDKDAYYTRRPDQNTLSLLLHQFAFTNFISLDRMPHAEIDEPIQPNSLFYLDRIFVQ